MNFALQLFYYLVVLAFMHAFDSCTSASARRYDAGPLRAPLHMVRAWLAAALYIVAPVMEWRLGRIDAELTLALSGS